MCMAISPSEGNLQDLMELGKGEIRGNDQKSGNYGVIAVGKTNLQEVALGCRLIGSVRNSSKGYITI
jgi:hypothetical protein